MPMPDSRTVGELLADSEALARETLLDATLEQAPAMVRSWNQLVGSAVELWAVLPSAPNSPSWSDPMERLRAIEQAISRSVTASVLGDALGMVGRPVSTGLRDSCRLSSFLTRWAAGG